MASRKKLRRRKNAGDFLEGVTVALWVPAWADWAEENGVKLRGKLEDLAPPAPDSAERAARLFALRLSAMNGGPSTAGAGIAIAVKLAEKAEGRSVDEHELGYSLTMQALGHGVSWDYDHKHFEIKLPLIEAIALKEGRAWHLETSGLGAHMNPKGKMGVKRYLAPSGLAAGTIWVVALPTGGFAIYQGPDPFKPGGARPLGIERTRAEAERFAKDFYSSPNPSKLSTLSAASKAIRSAHAAAAGAIRHLTTGSLKKAPVRAAQSYVKLLRSGAEIHLQAIVDAVGGSDRPEDRRVAEGARAALAGVRGRAPARKARTSEAIANPSKHRIQDRSGHVRQMTQEEEARFASVFSHYRKTHWGHEGKKKAVGISFPVPERHMPALGALVYAEYATTKQGDEGLTVYCHDFHEPFPLLVNTRDGKGLCVGGGKFRITARGIEG